VQHDQKPRSGSIQKENEFMSLFMVRSLQALRRDIQ
jgi:hypothetical protein